MLSKIRRYLSSHGLRATLAYLVARAGFIVSPPETASETRIRISRSLSEQLQHRVISGLFTGMTLSAETTWGRGDRGGQLLGLYEQEVQASIRANHRAHHTLIDIGAADGYYAVGCLFASLFEACHAFEANAASRSTIHQLGRANGVAERLTIHGTCTPGSLLALPAPIRAGAFVLIDIEGGEFDLLNNDVLAAFPDAFYVIEYIPSTIQMVSGPWMSCAAGCLPVMSSHASAKAHAIPTSSRSSDLFMITSAGCWHLKIGGCGWSG